MNSPNEELTGPQIEALMDSQFKSDILDALADEAGFLVLNDEPDDGADGRLVDLFDPYRFAEFDSRPPGVGEDSTRNGASLSAETDVRLAADGAAKHDPWLGAMVNGYRLLAEVGHGGGGVVYRALQTEPVRRIVAIKFLNTRATHNPRRLEIEKRTLLELDHPNIVTILDAGSWDGKIPYFVMKYVNGVPADEWAETSKASIRDIAALMLQVARTVSYAHSRGIIHRDLKPANLLVVRDRHFDESVDGTDQEMELEYRSHEPLNPSPSPPQGRRERGMGVGSKSSSESELEAELEEAIEADNAAMEADKAAIETGAESELEGRSPNSPLHPSPAAPQVRREQDLRSGAQDPLNSGPVASQGNRIPDRRLVRSGANIEQSGQLDRADRRRQPSSPDVYVTDFGLAKITVEGNDHSITDSATLLGSRGYLSPEQARVDTALLNQPAVDVYGLGATLYRLLTGLTPVRTESWAICLEDLKRRDPDSTRLINPKVPRDLDAICLKCLEKIPSQRYHSMDDLAADLQRFLTGQPVSARPLSGWGKLIRKARRQPVLYSLSATLLLGLMGAVITFGSLWQQSVNDRRQMSRNLELALNILKEEQEDAESLLIRVPGVMEYRIRRLDAAIDLLRQIVAENPHDTFPKRRLAVALYLRGSIPLHEGRIEQRQQNFLEAKRIFEELYALNPADHRLQFDIFHCLYAYPTETPEQSIEAKYHQQALMVIEDLATRFPDNDVYQDAYAAALSRISSLYTYDQFNQVEYAKTLAEKALRIAKLNAERHPNKPRYLRHIVGASRLLAQLSQSFPEYLEDIDYLYDALEAAKQLDAAEPDEPMNIMLLATAHSSIALQELRRGNRKLADEHQAAALATMDQAVQTFPDYTAIKWTRRDLTVWYQQALESAGQASEANADRD